MAEVIKKATRVAYGEALKALGAERDDVIVLDADLAGSTNTAKFRDAYPDRFFNCGIAEQNMIGIAAGIAASGFTVFASSFAMFASGRAFEQIRNAVGYSKLNVKVAATHGGISVGEDGASHQCNEDFALMRAIPGMTVIQPSDAVEAYQAILAAADYDGPVYLRLGRAAVPIFHSDDYKFEWGKGEQITDGNDVAIFATGLMVNEAIEAAKTLADEGIQARVINIHTLKPLDEELVVKAARECGAVVTAEEHNIIGGLGSAVCECLSEQAPTPVVRVGVPDVYGCSGPAAELLHLFGLDAEHLVSAAKEAIAKKA